jgi:hypothetical protein
MSAARRIENGSDGEDEIMKPAQYIVGWAAMTAILLASTAGVHADEVSCRAALSKAHEGYLIAVAKARAKEARGQLPGRNPIRPEVTAAKIEKARQKADRTIQAGCVGIPSPDAADPNKCIGLDFDDCLTEIVTESNTRVDAMQSALLPQGPVCLENPVCDQKNGLPLCDPDNGCFCHATTEGIVECVNEFSCENPQTCFVAADCPPGHECFVNTCCGPFGICGPVQCQPGGTGGPGGPGSATPQ